MLSITAKISILNVIRITNGFQLGLTRSHATVFHFNEHCIALKMFIETLFNPFVYSKTVVCFFGIWIAMVQLLVATYIGTISITNSNFELFYLINRFFHMGTPRHSFPSYFYIKRERPPDFSGGISVFT